MTTWNDVTAAAPELAEAVQRRFEATGLGFLATLRRDGAPRLSGIEPAFARGEVWLGMMPESRKARDLQRDPRMSLHAASVDKEVKDGDARLSGRAVEVVDEARKDELRAVFAEVSGQEPPPGPMHLFHVDVTEVVFLRLVADHLLIESWTPERGHQRVERG